jgi:hypothetical protein
VGEPRVDVLQHVPARAAGELVPDGFVALAGLGLLQRAELAQRLELIGAGRDPGSFAQLGFPGSGGRGVGGELRLDDVVGLRVVDRVRGRVGKQLVDALPLRELRPAAGVVGEVLMAGVSWRAWKRASSRAAATAAAVIPFARRRTTRRPIRAWSSSSRGAAGPGTGWRRVRRGGRGLLIRASHSGCGISCGPPPERCATARE